MIKNENNYKEKDCVNKYRMPSIKRTLQDVERLYKEKTANIQTFYSDKFLNDRGSIIDTVGNRVVVTDWIAEQLIKDDLLSGIETVCSPLPYIIGHTKPVPENIKGDVNREEEKIAHRLFERETYHDSDIDFFVEYQAPICRDKALKEVGDTNYGKVDLVALSEEKKEIYLMELKRHHSKKNQDETLLRCVCECYTYWKQICHQKLALEIALKYHKDEYKDYKIVPTVLVFESQYQHMQFRSSLLRNVQILMQSLGVRFFVISSEIEYNFDTYRDYINSCIIKELPLKIMESNKNLNTPYDNSLSNELDYAIKATETDKDTPGYLIGDKTFDNYMSNESFEKFLDEMPDDVKVMFIVGDGSELSVRNIKGVPTYPPKMASFGSSSRMIYNLTKDIPYFGYEIQLSTTVGGTANLDGYTFTPEKHIFVEAKCREPYSIHTNKFSAKYEDLFKHLNKSDLTDLHFDIKKINEKQITVKFYINGNEITHFDIKQMICHLLGIASGILSNELRYKPVKFLYLIYNPQRLEFEDEKIKNKILDIYNKTCNESTVITKELFGVIVKYLKDKHYNNSKVNIDDIVNNFSFIVCDQNNFKDNCV